jgi:hypothetical protein
MLNNVVYCMEQPSDENVNQIVFGIANRREYLSEEEIRQMLTALNNVTDPEQIERIRRRITIISIMYGIDLNPYLDPQMQLNTANAQGNSGNPLVPESINWRNVAISLGLFIGFSALIYAIVTNREFLFDLLSFGARNIFRLFPGLHSILNNREAAATLFDALQEDGVIPQAVATAS